MKNKKRLFIVLIIVIFLLFALAIVSNAAPIPEIEKKHVSPSFGIDQFKVPAQIILFTISIVLPTISIIMYIISLSKLKAMEKSDLQDESKIQLLKEEAARRKKKIGISFIIGIILWGITGMLQMTMTFKPVIYIYPEKDNTEVTVTLSDPDRITCSYPEYNDGWNVVADKDGTIREYGKDREY